MCPMGNSVLCSHRIACLFSLVKDICGVGHQSQHSSYPKVRWIETQLPSEPFPPPSTNVVSKTLCQYRILIWEFKDLLSPWVSPFPAVRHWVAQGSPRLLLCLQTEPRKLPFSWFRNLTILLHSKAQASYVDARVFSESKCQSRLTR